MQIPEDEALGALIRSDAARHRPPSNLTSRVQADLLAAAGSAAPPTPAPSGLATPPRRRWIERLALLGAGAATAWSLALLLLVTPQSQRIGDAVTASHVRSLMESHLTDVASSDRHRVKPWFAGKLDFSPPVIDLGSDEFTLAGGRLDYLDGRAVAALVYRAGPHAINLFFWPAANDKSAPPVLVQRKGWNIVHWAHAGMQAWAVSDASAAKLQAFAELASRQMGEPDPAAPSRVTR